MRKLLALAFALFVVIGLATPASAATSRHFSIPYYSASFPAAAGSVTINGNQVCVRKIAGPSGYVSARAYNSAGQQIGSITDSTSGSGYVCFIATGINKVTAGLYLFDNRSQYAYNMNNYSQGTLVSDFQPG